MGMVREVLWRRRLAGGFVLCGEQKNRRRDADATKIQRSLLCEAGFSRSELIDFLEGK
jgi:hypothetical protein